ncbi:LamG-like jellyroll fold domain-containing protein [Beggiatoa leptomitoformis]|uniref:WSC domain-containing protein n=1 Tax=Beggiatoa leptomitoformis TaxID=288004 RepID=A0A2N9YDR8_9GAMM|nr:LamG-like jellyroll fold domain-containing protein [Beggiatoa leptomitoformis]ALG68980.2 hypothetical protein AL038_16390 [Beggiatoa leptomitoformis]AUI68627.2 hypothetical protein BLE401_07855 [Beggiatoa leptomitoformis]
MKCFKSVITAVLISLCAGFVSSSYADDTELYLKQVSTGSSSTFPNILLVLDKSGSMNYYDYNADGSLVDNPVGSGVAIKRIDMLKEALYQLLDEVTNVNIGLMSFTSGSGAIPVVFPIADVNQPISEIPGENSGVATALTYVTSANDDAEERLGTASDTNAGAVSLNDGILDITRFANGSSTDVPPRTYVGCFVEQANITVTNRDLSASTLITDASTLTLDSCSLSCQNQGYRFMGLENGKYCSCGDTYGSLLTSATCTSSSVTCSGDSTQQCGASAANAIWDLRPVVVSPHNIKYNNSTTGTATGISGDTTKTDNVSGITYVGTSGVATDPVYGTGKVNTQALSFDGLGAHVRINDAYSLLPVTEAPVLDTPMLNQGSIAFWFKPTVVTSGAGLIHKGDKKDVSDEVVSINITGTNLYAKVGGNNVTTSGITITAGNWYHVVVTWNKTGTTTSAPTIGTSASAISASAATQGLRFYINGVLRGTSTSSTSFTDNQAGWNIGAKYDELADTTNLNRPFNGLMDEIVFSPINWTPSKVASVYNSGSGLKLPVPATTTTTTTTTTAAVGYDQKIGVRFQNVRVPQGAIIKSAKIIFTTDENSFTPNSQVSVKVEDVDNSAEFTTAKNNISSRSLWSTQVLWTLSAWTLPTVDPDNPDLPLVSSYDTGSITNLVQQVVSRSGWCGGNAMTFVLSAPTGYNPLRRALSYDDSPSYAPQLEITFDAFNYNSGANKCVQQTVSSRITNSGDDAEEQLTDHSVFLTSPVLEMTTTGTGSDTTSRLVGLRFPAVALEKGASIRKATLIFTSSPDGSTPDASNAKLSISGEKGVSAAFKSDVVSDLSNRTKTNAKATWNITDTWSKGQAYTSPDITNVVTEIISDTNWKSGSYMTFFVSGTGLRQVGSVDGERTDATLVAPRLKIEVDQTGTDFSPLVKERLADLIKQHTPTGGTPIVDTLYEAYLYYVGGAVINGQNSSGVSTSHVAATTVKGGKNYYVAPTSNVCSENHVVLLTDGAANGNSAQSLVKSLTKKSACQATFTPFNARTDITLSTLKAYNTKFTGSELCGADMAEYMNTNDVDPNIDGSNLTLHTIGLRLKDPFYNKSDGNNGAFGMMSNGFGYVSIGGYSRSADYQNSNCSSMSSYYCGSNGTSAISYYYQEWTGMSSRDQAFETARKKQWDTNTEVKVIKEMTFKNTVSGVQVTENFYRTTGNRWVKQSNGSYTFQSTDVKIHYALYQDIRESGLSTMALAYLSELAQKGGGGFYFTDSVESLLNAFRTIVAGAVTESATFAAPSISVSAFNRLYHRNEIYFASFKPERTYRWAGNVKKYLICESSSNGCTPGELLDATNQRAACSSAHEADDKADPNCIRYEEFAPGNVKSTASSFWGKESCTLGDCTKGDGNVVTKGGSGVMIPSYTTRNIVTCLSDSCASFKSFSDADVKAKLATDNELTDTTTIDLLADWIRGKDVRDEDKDTIVDENRWAFADPLHSSPTSVTFGTATKSYTKLFVGTNDGLIRMINAETGTEEWAFLPKELFGIQNSLMINKESLSRIYGVDGTAQFWINDKNQNGVIETASGDFVRMYIGMRRGGKNIYAFDLTYGSNGAVTPKLIWTIKGGTGDFAELAYTWSAPKVTAVNFGDQILVTLIFGGGFPGDVEGQSNSGGNALFIVNAKTGALIWKGGSDITTTAYTNYKTKSSLKISKMTYGVPSEIAFMDSTGDNTTDRLYVGDIGGQVWRIDLSGFSDSTVGNPIVGLLANVGDSSSELNGRKFFYAPEIARVPTPDIRFADAAYDAVAIGSGNRPNPLGRVIQDEFFVFQDKAVTYDDMKAARESDGSFKNCAGTPTTASATDKKFCTISQTNMYDATTDVIGTNNDSGNNNAVESQLKYLQNSRGWYIDFSYSDGEKNLASPIILENKVFFTTYLPPFDPNSDPGAGKMVICHYPPGNPTNMNTITISESAWSAHEAHGDTKGPCSNSICQSSGDGSSKLYAVSLYTAVSAYGDERSRDIKEGITSDVSAMFLSNGDIRIVSNDPDTASSGLSQNGAANDALGTPLAVQPVNAGSIDQITLTPTFWMQE